MLRKPCQFCQRLHALHHVDQATARFVRVHSLHRASSHILVHPPGCCCCSAGTINASCTANSTSEYCLSIAGFSCRYSYRLSSEICRAAAGACDAPELCSGTSTECPADVLLPSSLVCRAASVSPPMPAQNCTGSSTTCPAVRHACSMFLLCMLRCFCLQHAKVELDQQCDLDMQFAVLAVFFCKLSSASGLLLRSQQ